MNEKYNNKKSLEFVYFICKNMKMVLLSYRKFNSNLNVLQYEQNKIND